MKPPRAKVLFALPSLRGGGAEGVMVTLLQHLDRSLFEPHLALIKAEGVHLQRVPPDVPLHDLKANRARYMIPSFVRLAWRLRPQLVVSTLGHLNLTLILARKLLPRNVRLVVREGTVVSAILDKHVEYPWVWRWLYRHLYGKADAIVCQSDYMLEDLARSAGLSRDKLFRIYNPVDLQRITELSLNRSNPYCGDGPHLLAVGRLAREKGYDVLLDAMALVHQAIPHAQLTILGTGPLRETLLAQRNRLGLTEVVRFIGFEPNPYPYFRHADLFVLSSRYEGFPNALLEALVLGTRAIATDCPGGAREVAAHFPRCFFVKSENAGTLATAILDVLSADRSKTRQENAQVRPEAFDLYHVTAQYEALFQRVIDARPA